MKSVSLVPSFLRVPGSKFRRHGHLRLPLTMLVVASLAFSSLLFLAPIPVHAAPPSVTTVGYDDVGQTTATLNGNLTDLGGEDYECEVWFEYGETTLYGSSTTHQDMSSTGSFSDGISGLSAGTTYHFRAAASNVDGTSYGGDQQFTTDAETYMLTIGSTSGGSVTTPGQGTFGPYGDGDTVNLVAQPNLLWEFTEWTGDVSTMADANAAETTITMHGNYSITANFALRTHTLNIANSGGGSVTVPGEGTFVRGRDEVVPLLAVPGTGYAFSEWTGDVSTVGDVNAADTTITMQGDYSITANFTPLRALTIEIPEGDEGSTTPGAGTHQYPQGTVVDITAYPADGWQFDGWVEHEEDDPIADPGASSTTITMNASYYIIANFSEITDPTYTLTMEAEGGGSTIPPWGEHQILQSDPVVTITANANDGWTFVNWIGSGVDAGAVDDPDAESTTITMDNDYEVTAVFARSRTLTIEIVGSGSTTPSAGEHHYADGTEVEITATPASGWQFDGWGEEVDAIADSSAASTTITMNANYYITANFSEITGPSYTLGVAFTGEGVTEPSPGERVYAQGDDIGIAATPAEGWAFGGWTGTGVDAGAVEDPTEASTSITMNGDYLITANFVRADSQEVTASEDTPLEITLTASGLNGDPLQFNIVDQPAHGQLSGALPNLTYTPNEGYTGSDSFTFRVYDGTNYTNTATVTITVEPGGTAAESDNDDTGIPPWVWILLAGGSIVAGAIALLVMERRSAATE